MVRKFSDEQRAAYIQQFRKSHVPQRQFAQSIGISYSTLKGWLYRDHKEKKAVSGFVRLEPEAVIPPPPTLSLFRFECGPCTLHMELAGLHTFWQKLRRSVAC